MYQSNTAFDHIMKASYVTPWRGKKLHTWEWCWWLCRRDSYETEKLLLNCLPLICLGGRADDHRVGGRHYFAISPPLLLILLMDLLATHFWICGSAQTWICRESSNIFGPGTLRGGGGGGQACYLQTLHLILIPCQFVWESADRANNL